jgi:hypothetical protein
LELVDMAGGLVLVVKSLNFDLEDLGGAVRVAEVVGTGIGAGVGMAAVGEAGEVELVLEITEADADVENL